MAHKPHIDIAIMPSPGMGHLIPFVEFAKRLLLRHSIPVTLILPTAGPPTNAFLQGLPDGANYVFLPPVNFEEGVKAETQIAPTVARSLSSVGEVLKSLVANN